MAAYLEVYKDGVRVADAVIRADDFRQRLRGLSGVKTLPSGGGCWLSPCHNIHTFTMRLPIDVLFLTRDGVVADIEHAMAPGRMRNGPKTADGVLELAAGSSVRWRIRPGDRLEMREKANQSKEG